MKHIRTAVSALAMLSVTAAALAQFAGGFPYNPTLGTVTQGNQILVDRLKLNLNQTTWKMVPILSVSGLGLNSNSNAWSLATALDGSPGSGITKSYVAAWRNGIDSNYCVVGTLAATDVCQFFYVTADARFIQGGPATPGTPNSAFRFQGITQNNSIGFLRGSHGPNGTQSYAFGIDYSNTGSTKFGWEWEILPSTATSASTASRTPRCGNAPAIPYNCLGFTTNVHWQVMPQNTSVEGFGWTGGVDYQSASYVGAGAVQEIIGDATNAASWLQFNGPVSYNASNPTISTCGVGPAVDAQSSNQSGTVTVGTGAIATCTITFAVAYTTFDHCRVTSESAVTSLAYSYTLSAITVTATSLTSDKLDYSCDGK